MRSAKEESEGKAADLHGDHSSLAVGRGRQTPRRFPKQSENSCRCCVCERCRCREETQQKKKKGTQQPDKRPNERPIPSPELAVTATVDML